METSDSDDLMDYSIYRIICRQAKNNHGIKNAKDVTTQIWETLFDFSSLKTCTRFNRFILDCVDVIWDLVAGIDGRMPRLKLDFECIGICFDPTRHIRSTDGYNIKKLRSN
uniref:Mitochondria-eating protein n=1 Tax=Panagrolaimus sp. PS1159 TaxID=55785 RepID=A0AC35F833_9BILA